MSLSLSSSSSSQQHPNMSTTSSSNSTDENSHAIVKGKRTKRQRSTALQNHQSPQSTSSAATAATTKEDEDMANCLILLAQGRALDINSTKPPPGDKIAATSTAGVYECKTCSKCFHTFQALGGHRASHKKPKTTPPTAMTSVPATAATTEEALEKKLATNIVADEGHRDLQLLGTAPPPAFPITIPLPSVPIAGVVANGNNSSSGANKGGRVHECSVCGSEFASGQALGGHMRRHRSATTAAAPQETHQQEEQEPDKLERSCQLFSLDLNLPAPSDDDRSTVDFQKPLPSTTAAAFPFFSPSAAALVDCHY